MNTLSNDFAKIKSIQLSMGYKMPDHLNEGLNLKEISQIENHNKLNFNEDLKCLYTIQNGMKEKGLILGEIGIIPIYYFFKLDDAIKYKDEFDWIEFKEFYDVDSDIGNSFFPFLHNNAGDCYWINLNLKSIDYGKVYWTNTLGEEPEYVFNSLSAFIKTIRTGYETNVFKLDNNGYLDMDFNKWKHLCNSVNDL